MTISDVVIQSYVWFLLSLDSSKSALGQNPQSQAKNMCHEFRALFEQGLGRLKKGLLTFADLSSRLALIRR